MLVRSMSHASAVMASTIFWRSEVMIARGWSRKLMPIQSSCAPRWPLRQEILKPRARMIMSESETR
eukprot:13722374-Heterocapsa_arctica.AAC.1